ncbi:hypothetical protein BJV82DRAFT_717192 [Fennellomyces sp. T-0311]|nr:hypothetical protein BJV82DRAFT_717192 [Fennellomyces sp. T-0311]
MSRFPTSLPPEMVVKIVLYLEQGDCIEYGIGNPTRILNTIKEKRCAIKRLVVHRCIMTNHFAAVLQYSTTLKKLEIECCPINLSVPKLLDHLPYLTHLSLWIDRNHVHQTGLISELEMNGGDTESNCTNLLVYLRLAGSMYFARHILPILRHCPKLKTLVVPQRHFYEQFTFDSDLDWTFQQCPDLCHFMCSWSSASGWESAYQARLFDDIDCVSDSGIQSFAYGGSLLAASSTILLLGKAQTTLKYLRIEQGREESGLVIPFGLHVGLDPLFQLRFPRLERLRLGNVDIPPAA